MTILAFLQNMWFKNPEAAKDVFARHPERRNQLIGTYLFMGCLTGQRLEAAFGDLCDTIIWEEVSPEIGGRSSAIFPADHKHMQEAIAYHKPDVILAFGKLASDALVELGCTIPVIKALHPAARNGAQESLSVARAKLRQFMEGVSATSKG